MPTSAPCRPTADTHQSEAHCVLATWASQSLQADCTVQLEGRLWARDLRKWGVSTHAEVELVEGIDILLGKRIQCQQLAAGQAGPVGWGAAGAKLSQSHTP